MKKGIMLIIMLIISIIMTGCGSTANFEEDTFNNVDSDYSSSYSSDYSSDYDDYDDYDYDYDDYDYDDYDYDDYDYDDYDYDDYDEGYGYDKSDPYYSENDHNNDGKLTDEEFQDAMADAIDDLYYEIYGY